MVRLGRGFPQSSTQLGFAAIDFVEIIIVLDNGAQQMTLAARDFASIDINDSEQGVVDLVGQQMTLNLRTPVVDIESGFVLERVGPMTMTLRTLDVLSINPRPGWNRRDRNRKNEKSRDHAFNRLQAFDDTTGAPGVDFAPIVSQFGYWRVSSTLRDTIALKSEHFISEELIEGRP